MDFRKTFDRISLISGGRAIATNFSGISSNMPISARVNRCLKSDPEQGRLRNRS